MAVYVYKDAYLSINAVDLSAYIQEVRPNFDAEMLDSTTMGDTTRENIAGLINWTIDVVFAQDHAAGQVDATLWPLLGAAAFAIIFKPNGDTTAVTNPKWTGNAVLSNYSIGGKVGDFSTASIQLKAGGALTRATSD